MVRNNLKYELMNVLFNLAALYSQLAINTPRGNTDGLKTAANYFSLGAGVLLHMKTVVLPELRMSDPPEDMDEHTLEALQQLLLAESQECFWQKAVMDGYKDASIAKLAAKVSDLYNAAGEVAVKSDAISGAWIHHMAAKHHHFAAAAQYRAACDCLEKRKYGEEVARLKDAVACVTEGVKETKGGYLNKTVVDDLNALKRKAEEDLKRAEKDNDMIYLQVVPPKSELKALERASMAVSRTPKQVSDPFEFLGEQAEFGPALFSRLVPFAVHVAMSIYEERRDRMVNQTLLQELENLTGRMQEKLSSLGLPGSFQALEKPLGLPPTLGQRAEEIRQADALNRIHKSFVDIDKLRAADMAVFEEGKVALQAEMQEDQQLRMKYGTDRWTRPDGQAEPQGAKLWQHAQEIEGYFQSSASSDGLVREKFAENEQLLRILSGSDRELMQYVPSSSTGRSDMPEQVKAAVGRIRGAYNDVLRMESRRRKKGDSLRDSVKQDDIKPDILKEAARLERTYPNTSLAPAHFEDLFEKRLDRLYEPEVEALAKESQEQEQLEAEIERLNREFESQKRQIESRGYNERQQALQNLDNAYFKYKEVVSNLDVGRKFYNDLSKIVGQGFRDVVKGWVVQRRMEARALEEELSMPPLSNLNISRTQTPQQQHQHQHQQQYDSPNGPPAAAIQSWAEQGVQQPKPTNPMGVWNPSSGIQFGESQGGQSGTWNPNSGIKFG